MPSLSSFSLAMACVFSTPSVADLCAPVSDLACTNFGKVDITTKSTHTASASECCAFCKDVQGCTAWTLSKSGECMAKKRCQQSVAKKGATSGFINKPYPLPPQNVCAFGLTFRGVNGTALDGDVLGESDLDLDLNQRGLFYKGPQHLLNTKAGRNLHLGCAHPGAWCHKADVAKYANQWVFVDFPGMVDGNVGVAAVCRSGCPDKYWLKGNVYDMVWELTGELGPVGSLKMSASCCARKPQQCDALHADPTACKAHCEKHNIGAGVVSPKCFTDACCAFVPNNPDFPLGSCECNSKPPPDACDHDAQSMETIV